MSCRFCNAELVAKSTSTCQHCNHVIERGWWLLLATIWLANRPEDWLDDVAGFLELTEGPGADVLPLRAG